MSLSQDAVARMAADYTAAWNSGDPEAVASFFSENGRIIINGGDPWDGRSRVRDMAAGFFADVPDLSLRPATISACPARTSSMSGPSPVMTRAPAIP
jgi:uncharacterized protein (TIGR02246 family)